MPSNPSGAAGAMPAIVPGSMADTASPSFYDRVKDKHLVALWTVPGTDQAHPEPPEVPHVWRWREIEPLLTEACTTMDLGADAQRRALNAVNPARGFGTTHTMIVGYQAVLPGETAPAHRHTPSAIRFMLAGRGHTVVNGEPLLMERGDLVLTPPWAWHDHRNDGDEPMVWLDGLDVPFIKTMHAHFYEDHPSHGVQDLALSEDRSVASYPAGLVAAGARPGLPHSPLTKYPWRTSHASLRRLLAESDTPARGVTLEYVNPLTGGPVLPTLACELTLLPPGGRSAARRETASIVCCVAEGTGHTVIGGQRFDWERNDFFAIPPWTWYEHVAEGADDAVLFVTSDRPLLQPFALYRAQTA